MICYYNYILLVFGRWRNISRKFFKMLYPTSLVTCGGCGSQGKVSRWVWNNLDFLYQVYIIRALFIFCLAAWLWTISYVEGRQVISLTACQKSGRLCFGSWMILRWEVKGCCIFFSVFWAYVCALLLTCSYFYLTVLFVSCCRSLFVRQQIWP